MHGLISNSYLPVQSDCNTWNPDLARWSVWAAFPHRMHPCSRILSIRDSGKGRRLEIGSNLTAMGREEAGKGMGLVQVIKAALPTSVASFSHPFLSTHSSSKPTSSLYHISLAPNRLHSIQAPVSFIHIAKFHHVGY